VRAIAPVGDAAFGSRIFSGGGWRRPTLVIANIDSSTDRHDARLPALKVLEKRVAELVFPVERHSGAWALDKKISRVNFYFDLFFAT
jgi:hypothetical protein